MVHFIHEPPGLYRFFFLWRFARCFFFRLCLAIFAFFLFFPHGMLYHLYLMQRNSSSQAASGVLELRHPTLSNQLSHRNDSAISFFAASGESDSRTMCWTAACHSCFSIGATYDIYHPAEQ